MIAGSELPSGSVSVAAAEPVARKVYAPGLAFTPSVRPVVVPLPVLPTPGVATGVPSRTWPSTVPRSSDALPVSTAP